MLSVVCSREALPWTVLTPRRCREGLWAARRMAKASCDQRQEPPVAGWERKARIGWGGGFVRRALVMVREGTNVEGRSNRRALPCCMYLCHSLATRVCAPCPMRNRLPFPRVLACAEGLMVTKSRRAGGGILKICTWGSRGLRR